LQIKGKENADCPSTSFGSKAALDRYAYVVINYPLFGFWQATTVLQKNNTAMVLNPIMLHLNAMHQST